MANEECPAENQDITRFEFSTGWLDSVSGKGIFGDKVNYRGFFKETEDGMHGVFSFISVSLW